MPKAAKRLLKQCLLLSCWFCALPALAENPRVLLDTSVGEIELELDAERAPLGVANFLSYVDSGFYDGTLFHRVIPGFMVQGGGFDQGMQQKPTEPPIANESLNGLENRRGSLAYARSGHPHSATSQFFINLVDNPRLNGKTGSPGYAVFGKVVRGMELVDVIARVPTGVRAGMSDVPQQDLLVRSARRAP